MAIATIERDAARGSGTSEPRFKLLQELCRTGDQQYWRGTDQRNGKPCVVRVIDAAREDSSRRLGELHRERLLAERIAHAAVLRPEVPLIEGERIFQLLQPEPARGVETVLEEGRLATLNLLAVVAAALAEAHARGAFHGALSRDSLLRSAEGRVLLQGFTGDAANAAAVRDGAAADHDAFMRLAQELLASTGGPPPRLRRYFTRELAPGAPRPASGAMASLADELRDSLEDTFPWPAHGSVAVDDVDTARLRALPERLGGVAVHAGRPSDTAAVPRGAPAARLASVPPKPKANSAAMPFAKLAADVVAQPLPATTPSAGASAALDRKDAGAEVETALAVANAPPLVVPESRVGRARAARSPGPATVTPPLAELPQAKAEGAVADPPRGSWRPWLAGAVLVAIVVAGWQYGQRRHKVVAPAPATNAMQPAAVAGQSPAAANRAASDAAGGDADATAAVPPADPQARKPAVTADALDRMAAATATSAAAAKSRAPEARAAAADAASTTPTRDAGKPAPAVDAPRDTAAARRTAAVPAPALTREASAERAAELAAAQATRSRVANLVAGGSRALNALEPQIAADAFAQALALAPGDPAAAEGGRRARRLLGAAALVRDAREAAARGDHARAVQGYAQALANDPRNRGLAEALTASRRSLSRDGAGTVLAAGHEALGAGRLEEARDAFERAMQLDPRDAGARRAAEQASTAILLRDAASERRLAANPPDTN